MIHAILFVGDPGVEGRAVKVLGVQIQIGQSRGESFLHFGEYRVVKIVFKQIYELGLKTLQAQAEL